MLLTYVLVDLLAAVGLGVALVGERNTNWRVRTRSFSVGQKHNYLGLGCQGIGG